MANKASNRGAADAMQRRTRKTVTPGSLTAHENAAGVPIADSGNDEAPYAWANPFQETLSEWVSLQALTTTANILEPFIELADFRVVTVLFVYKPNTDTSVLSVIPMVGGREGDAAFNAFNLDAPMFPLGFVRGTVTSTTGPGSGATPDLLDQTFATREVQPMRFLTVAGAQFLQVFTLDFDVSSYKRFTLAVSESGAGPTTGTLQLAYSRRV